MIGDLGANCSFYHKHCSANLYNRFSKKQKEECKGKIDIDSSLWRAYGITKYRNTDDPFLKIPIYRRVFIKIPIPKLFCTFQVSVCISRQPELNSFKI